MNLCELLLKSISESKLVQNEFIKEIDEEVDESLEVPQDEQEFKRVIIEYMTLKGIELNQTNYDYVAEQMTLNQGKEIHHVVKKKKKINLLEGCSLEELKDVLQICIFKQNEKIYEMLESNGKMEYEYAIERIMDERGSTNVVRMSEVMSSYAKQGWHVKTVFTNELGHDSSVVSVGMVSGGVNSTADEVIIVFERCK